MDIDPRVLNARGVEVACPVCKGLGVRLYANGSTWRGGMGTNMYCRDVCDTCWGSGDANRHWQNLRDLDKEIEEMVAKMAGEYLARRCGAGLRAMRPAIYALADKLPRVPDKDGVPGFHVLKCALAEALREMVEEKK